MEKLEKQVKQLGISDNVKFTGYVPHSKIPEFVSLADVVVAPYKEVGMPFFNSPIKIS